MASGLYKPSEIAVMTDDALDELLSHYSDTGNTEGVRRVQDELRDRAAEADEMAYEAEQDRKQMLHDEWLDATFG